MKNNERSEYVFREPSTFFEIFYKKGAGFSKIIIKRASEMGKQ